MSHIFSRINPLYLHIRCRHRELRDSFHIVIVVIVFILQILCSRIIHCEYKELVDQGDHHRDNDPKDHGTGGYRKIEVEISYKDHSKLGDHSGNDGDGPRIIHREIFDNEHDKDRSGKRSHHDPHEFISKHIFYDLDKTVRHLRHGASGQCPRILL